MAACSLFIFHTVTVPVWIGNCDQCFCSSTLKICCFSHSKANPKTSALQSLQKFIASLCALFLNTGSNILCNPSAFNMSSDYLLTNALYMSKYSSWCAGVWQRCSYLKTNVQMSLVEVSWGEAWKQAIPLLVSVDFDPVWNQEICTADHYHIVLAVAATAGGGCCPHRPGPRSTSSALAEFRGSQQPHIPLLRGLVWWTVTLDLFQRSQRLLLW